ncbi:Methyltransferase SCO0408 [Alloactinosynnema sp. L-07]|uniref:methyltransferase domain-containing protein n=1 Tax=Alloactinosynnema sp. L-07 TaxID=1653480 RepID=UPI00065EF578|nr:methyltransferase domain-containing protein [Alloactinosynnema sp. L-07]CRK56203.1 Methyltransferase SCO0408 [Alloactinosynnema sp. L-07]
MTAVPDIGYGRQFAGFYDRLFPADAGVDQAVAFLAALHPGDGSPTLEFGVGTGRVAVPLSERVGEVVGVDSSPEMLDVLRAAVGDRPVAAVHADIRDYTDGRSYGLVYCVCGTLSMLLDPEEQRRAVKAAARRLAPGGRLVIETHNPAIAEALNQGKPRDSFFVPYPAPDTGLLSYSTVDLDNRLWHLAHIFFDDGRARVAAELSRLTTAEETDHYARSAGLELVDRHADFWGNPFTGAEPMTVSVYRAASDV